jgi:ligand-binding SRPBCC domain-containing protein
MTRFEQSFVVDRHVVDVWNFYTDIQHLRVITPPAIAIKVESNTSIKQGAEIMLSGNLIRKSRWKARITYCKPYEYIDEMIDGPFKIWKHIHRFVADNSSTKVIDIVEYELPYGIFGKMVDRIYVRRKIQEIFQYRKRATVRVLENTP